MKEPDWKTCSEKQMWEYVAAHLAKNGIDTVLVGGAVVSVYTDGIYRSGDLDFVILTYFADHLPKVMKEIGFRVEDSRHYRHPECNHLIIDFASGPPAIGEDYRIQPAERKVGKQTIKLYSPTDCIKDRLASYIYFHARECLDQAVLVAQKHAHDRKKIESWCANERRPDVWEEFDRLTRRSG